MRLEDVVESIGKADAVHHLQPQVHAPRHVEREDWAVYMAEPIRELWRMVCREKDAWLLQKATFADWEDFCWRLTRLQPQSHYSARLQALDGLRD